MKNQGAISIKKRKVQGEKHQRKNIPNTPEDIKNGGKGLGLKRKKRGPQRPRPGKGLLQEK